VPPALRPPADFSYFSASVSSSGKDIAFSGYYSSYVTTGMEIGTIFLFPSGSTSCLPDSHPPFFSPASHHLTLLSISLHSIARTLIYYAFSLEFCREPGLPNKLLSISMHRIAMRCFIPVALYRTQAAFQGIVGGIIIPSIRQLFTAFSFSDEETDTPLTETPRTTSLVRPRGVLALE
jgi:hypothetical protein